MNSNLKYLSMFLAVLIIFVQTAYGAAPEYTGAASVVLNDDIPDIDDLYTDGEEFIYYEPLDKWLRPARAVACLGPELLSMNYRYSMSDIMPSGWQNDTYDFIPGYNLFQRCHLIGNQLGGDEIEANVITGTQYLNIVGMLPIENQIAEYIRTTGNHVLYSVWPYYGVGNYLCYGVQIEAKSVEDDTIRINRYCFNVQPGVSIDYRTGLSHLAGVTAKIEIPEEATASTITYILNTNTKRFHLPTCSSCEEMKPKNRQETTLTREELIDMGYKPCGRCNP